MDLDVSHGPPLQPRSAYVDDSIFIDTEYSETSVITYRAIIYLAVGRDQILTALSFERHEVDGDRKEKSIRLEMPLLSLRSVSTRKSDRPVLSSVPISRFGALRAVHRVCLP